jgi:putative tricarboxylic transport membrane protein
MGFILGPMLEENLRRTLMLSHGDATVLFTRPLSAVLLSIAAGLLLLMVLPFFKEKRAEAFVEE